MTAPFFYGDPAELDSVDSGDSVALRGDEGRHAVTVKRLAVGEPILIGDGTGLVVHATIDQLISKSELSARVERVARVGRPRPTVTVVQALIKGDRMERAIETLTEAGVDRIVLWQSQRSIVRVDATSGAKLQAKATNRAQQAAKQARRALIPKVSAVVSTAKIVGEIGDGASIVVLHEDAPRSLSDVIAQSSARVDPPQSIAVVVGPEGGISPEELGVFDSLGATPVQMGPSVMRASTAGTVALGWVMGAVGRWTVRD